MAVLGGVGGGWWVVGVPGHLNTDSCPPPPPRPTQASEAPELQFSAARLHHTPALAGSTFYIDTVMNLLNRRLNKLSQDTCLQNLHQ